MYSIGKGTRFSFAKAALLFYYYKTTIDCPEIYTEEDSFLLNYGNIEDMHDIVSLAGGRHQGPLTPHQVSGRLYNSPYWNKKTIRGFYSGMRGHGKAVLYTPSQKGKEYYKKHLEKYLKYIRDERYGLILDIPE